MMSISDTPMSPQRPPSYAGEHRKQKTKHNVGATSSPHSSRSPPPLRVQRKHRGEDCASPTSNQPLSPLRLPSDPPTIQLFDKNSSPGQAPHSEIELPELLLASYRTTVHRRDRSREAAENSSEGTSPESPRSQMKSSASLENLPEESLTDEEIQTLVKQGKYCMSTDSEEKAELLLLWGECVFG